MQHLMAFWNPACWTGEMLQRASLFRCELAPCHPSPSVGFQDSMCASICVSMFHGIRSNSEWFYTPCVQDLKWKGKEKKKKKNNICAVYQKYGNQTTDLEFTAIFSVTIWLGVWQTKTGCRLRDSVTGRRNCLAAVMRYLDWFHLLLPLFLFSIQTEKKRSVTFTCCFTQSCWQNLSGAWLYLSACASPLLISCVLSGLLEGFLRDRRARLQSGVRARHLDDFFFFFRGASPSPWKCQVCTEAMPSTAESVWWGHAIFHLLQASRSIWNKDDLRCHIKGERRDFC